MKTNHKILIPLFSAVALLGIPACDGGAGGSANQVPLDYDIPRELTIGTPKDIDVENLETSPNEEPIMVAEGHELLSHGKPVTTSDDGIPWQGTPDMITNGEVDGNEGFSFILGSPGLQWVQIDLEDTYFIDAVVFWHFFREDRVYHDVIVQVSNDENFETGVTTLFNNDHDNSSGLGAGSDRAFIGTNRGKQVAGNGTEARYVRLYSNGNTDNDLNEYIEVQVFGRPLEGDSEAEGDEPTA